MDTGHEMEMNVMEASPDKASQRANSKRKRRVIGFLTVNDARDRSSWSGTVYYMSEALQRNCGDVVYLGPIQTPWTYLGKFLQSLSLRLTGKKYDYVRAKWYASRLAAIAQKRIAKHDLDCIVAPAAAAALAYIRKPMPPVFFVSDTTFSLINNYYKSFSGYLRVSITDGNQLAKLAMDRARFVSFPSRWAAKSAINDYGVAPEKIHVIPFGANLDNIPNAEVANKRQLSGECRLLFLGVDWIRKGGDIALEALLSLEKDYGIKAHLTVCGCEQPRGVDHERITWLGFLDKRDPVQLRKLAGLFEETDYLLLPTRNECYGVVFCEASAYGVPSITTDTGGVPGVVAEGKNGYLLPEEARGDRYAKVIAGLENDEQAYRELCLNSRREYESRINWDVWAEHVGKLFDSVVKRNS